MQLGNAYNVRHCANPEAAVILQRWLVSWHLVEYKARGNTAVIKSSWLFFIFQALQSETSAGQQNVSVTNMLTLIQKSNVN